MTARMTKRRVTVLIDPTHLDELIDLVPPASVSALVEQAIGELWERRSVQRWIDSLAGPRTTDDISLEGYQTAIEPLDDTDWEALYPEPDSDASAA